MNAGWAAHSGVTAATLAREGFNSPMNIFEGSNGWFSAYALEGNYDLSQITSDLGSRYEIVNTAYKPYACCRYCHGPIDAAWGVMKEHDLSREQIEQNAESIEVRTVREAVRICANPKETKMRPVTDVDAQFSIYFAVAVALLYGKPGTTLLDFWSDKTRKDPRVLNLASKIKVNQDPELEKTYPKYIPASINIRMKDGKEYFYKVKTPKGDPEWQLTREELKVRFQDLAGRVFDNAHVERIYNEVYGLEGAKDITRLVNLCVKEGK
jgi:2-methylcitrate dehydratase PrpD